MFINMASSIIRMGRIKTMLIKRTVNKLLDLHRDKFTNKFDNNKKFVVEVADIPSKKLRNIIAGYITKRVKQSK